MAEAPLYGRVAEPLPTDDSELVYVKFPLQDGGQQVHPCRWQGANAPSLNQPCCVVFTDELPWALGIGA